MAQTVLTKSSYSTLLADLKRIIEEGKRRAKQAAQRSPRSSRPCLRTCSLTLPGRFPQKNLRKPDGLAPRRLCWTGTGRCSARFWVRMIPGCSG